MDVLSPLQTPRESEMVAVVLNSLSNIDPDSPDSESTSGQREYRPWHPFYYPFIYLSISLLIAVVYAVIPNNNIWVFILLKQELWSVFGVAVYAELTILSIPDFSINYNIS